MHIDDITITHGNRTLEARRITHGRTRVHVYDVNPETEAIVTKYSQDLIATNGDEKKFGSVGLSEDDDLWVTYYTTTADYDVLENITDALLERNATKTERKYLDRLLSDLLAE